jgi:4-hydroxy 2-oxovalerate aldolase
MLPIDQVSELLNMIDESKKISFDKDYAEELYRTYNEGKSVDDTSAVSDLRQALTGKKVLVIAPGKSINQYKSVIEEFMTTDVVTIGLNLTSAFDVDYLMITRKEVFEMALNEGKSIITTSNVSKGARGKVSILDYKKWIDIQEGTQDSSAVICLNLLKYIGITEIMLAGFDGFSININENYADPNLRRPVNEEQAHQRNSYYKSFIGSLKQLGIDIKFLTPSLYE